MEPQRSGVDETIEEPDNDEPNWDCNHYSDRPKPHKAGGCLLPAAVITVAVIFIANILL